MNGLDALRWQRRPRPARPPLPRGARLALGFLAFLALVFAQGVARGLLNH